MACKGDDKGNARTYLEMTDYLGQKSRDQRNSMQEVLNGGLRLCSRLVVQLLLYAIALFDEGDYESALLPKKATSAFTSSFNIGSAQTFANCISRPQKVNHVINSVTF